MSDIDYDSIIADYGDGCAELQSEIDNLTAENKCLRQYIAALIEVYAPTERKATLRREYLE